MQFFGQTIDGEAATNWPKIQAKCAEYPRFVIKVERYSEQKEISDRQMAYLHAVVFPTLAREMTCSLWEAEFTCKRQCGEQWLLKKMGDLRFVLSKTVLTTKQCNQWIENIWDWADKSGVHIPQPDKDWRKNELQQNNLNGQPDS